MAYAMRLAGLPVGSFRVAGWLTVFCLVAGVPGSARQATLGRSGEVVITVEDENHVAVASAQVTLVPSAGGPPVRGQTDFDGRAIFPNLASGVYQVTIEKMNFYPVTVGAVDLTEHPQLEITLPHSREFNERVEVRYTPPAINQRETTASHTLSRRDILNVPYPVNRDYRNILPLIPGVTPDADGQFHINGSIPSQIYEQMDGFDISQPVTGLLSLRVSPDALRSIEVVGARLPATLGKGSGEALSLETDMGDDHFRFGATDFIPSFQSKKGFHIEAFTPRFSLSGPIRRGHAWFYDAGQGEYNLGIVQELPAGADEAPNWRWNNLAKVQWNLNASNRLTSSFLINRFRSPRNGLDPLDPLATTTNLSENADLATIKDQLSLPGGSLLEFGFAYGAYASDSIPRGVAPYVLRPEGASGNFFETNRSTARRWQAIASLWMPAFAWHGRHRLRFGLDLDRITYHQALERGPILIYRENGTLDRWATFSGLSAFDLNNVETSGYVEDGWSPAKRLFINAGLRFDWDEILRRPLLSPRLAASWMLSASGQTKLSAGVGHSYPATNLALFGIPRQGERSDQFYAADGTTPLGPPVVTGFSLPSGQLSAPRFLNWSASLERMLSGQTHLEIEYLGKRGSNGFDYQQVGTGPAPGLPSGQFVLQASRNDVYDGVRITVRYPLRRDDMILVSYTRSRARSNAVLIPSLDSLIFSPQLPGPLLWDSPNRFLSWGWAPLPYKIQLDYTFDWRSGYPFNVVDQDQRLVGLPGSHRFPDYVSLNLFLERRFRIFGYEWALRGGYDDITGRRNPSAVYNNIDSPLFLTFTGIQGRAFTGRIRFLGRK